MIIKHVCIYFEKLHASGDFIKIGTHEKLMNIRKKDFNSEYCVHIDCLLTWNKSNK